MNNRPLQHPSSRVERQQSAAEVGENVPRRLVGGADCRLLIRGIFGAGRLDPRHHRIVCREDINSQVVLQISSFEFKEKERKAACTAGV